MIKQFIWFNLDILFRLISLIVHELFGLVELDPCQSIDSHREKEEKDIHVLEQNDDQRIDVAKVEMDKGYYSMTKVKPNSNKQTIFKLMHVSYKFKFSIYYYWIIIFIKIVFFFISWHFFSLKKNNLMLHFILKHPTFDFIFKNEKY